MQNNSPATLTERPTGRGQKGPGKRDGTPHAADYERSSDVKETWWCWTLQHATGCTTCSVMSKNNPSFNQTQEEGTPQDILECQNITESHELKVDTVKSFTVVDEAAIVYTRSCCVQSVSHR